MNSEVDLFKFDLEYLEWKSQCTNAAEVIRMSRGLEVILGLNVNIMFENESGGGFPTFTSPLPEIGIQRFTRELFWNPPIQKLAQITKSNVTKQNFWMASLRHYQIPFVIIKINQDYKDDDAFPGSSFNSLPTIEYPSEDSPTDDARGLQYSDYFVFVNKVIMPPNTSVIKTLFDASRLIYNKYGIPLIAPTPHMIGLTR